MGTHFVTRHGFIEGTVDSAAAGPRLVGTRIVLDYPSHTTTDNLMMAATLAKGTTIIENAAREPEVCDLAALPERDGCVGSWGRDLAASRSPVSRCWTPAVTP